MLCSYYITTPNFKYLYFWRSSIVVCMRSFFKTVLASLLALAIFSLLIFFIITAVVKSLGSSDKPVVRAKSVLVIDLGQSYDEQQQSDPLAILGNDPEKTIPGLYDVLRLIHKAKSDKNITSIYLLAKPSSNGFAARSEIRDALLDFKQAGKFIIAHGDVLTQSTYSIANVADKIYVSPQGMVEWFGFNVQYAFLKGTLEKLDIQPQIFYAGKFKSATEPFRSDRMTEENRLQTTVWMNDLYNEFLQQSAVARKMDTATLRQLAKEARIRSPKDAADNKLVDGVKYDDEVKDEIKQKLGIGKYDRINFITINTYRAVGGYVKGGGDKIALIYANGDIIDGKADQGRIGGESYRSLIRKARLDKTIKAIVLRINSG